MGWLNRLVVCAALVCHCGCQNFGGGGYPMQSVTRVPPPGTGSYPMQGGYYNPTGAQTSLAPGASPVSATVSNAGTVSDTGTASAGSYVAQAQYTASDSNTSTQTASAPFSSAQLTESAPALPAPTAEPTSLPQPATFSQQSGSQSAPTLQWQGIP